MEQTLKVYGPTPHGRRWRVELREGTRRSYKSFESPADAARWAEQARKKAAVAGVSLDHYLTKYVEHLGRQNLSKATLSAASYAARGLLQDVLDQSPLAITPDVARKLYKAAQSKWAVAYHREALYVARRVWKWLERERVVRSNPWTTVEPEGRPNRGKTQLTLDETRKFSDVLVARLDTDAGALPVLMALLMGLRVGEILNATSRDVDDGGRLFRANGKTGLRVVGVPDVLVEPLRRRALVSEGGKLFPFDASGIRYRVERYCKLAGVTSVTTHGLRGTCSTLSIRLGTDPNNLARALGQTLAVNRRHYTAPGALETANSEIVSNVIFMNRDKGVG